MIGIGAKDCGNSKMHSPNKSKQCQSTIKCSDLEVAELPSKLFQAPYTLIESLVSQILLTESIETEAVTSICQLASSLHFQGFKGKSTTHCPKDHQECTFVLNNCSDPVFSLARFLQLRVKINKGSLLTYLWNSFARFDEEISVYITNDPSSSTHDTSTLLFTMRGIDVNNKNIVYGMINWNKMKILRFCSGINRIGVHAFTKALGMTHCHVVTTHPCLF